MKAEKVIEALRRWHLPINRAREWAFFTEVRVGTGYRTYKTRHIWNPERRMDAWAMNLWPSKGNIAIAYEVKVSRQDFKSEISDPGKRNEGLALSNQFYFVTPVGLVETGEIPEECGLIEILESGKLKFKVKAPFRTIEPFPVSFLAAISRRGTDAESLNISHVAEIKRFHDQANLLEANGE
jgi:hypothetical protein